MAGRWVLDYQVDENTFPYELDDLSAWGGTPMARGKNVPSTSTANRDVPEAVILRRISSRITKGKPAEKLNL